MQRCNSQDEEDLIRYLFYTLNSLSEYEELSHQILETMSDPDLDEECTFVNYSFYNFTFTDDFFTTYEKRESVNWQKEGF
jgi:hypothetical protein